MQPGGLRAQRLHPAERPGRQPGRRAGTANRLPHHLRRGGHLLSPRAADSSEEAAQPPPAQQDRPHSQRWKPSWQTRSADLETVSHLSGTAGSRPLSRLAELDAREQAVCRQELAQPGPLGGRPEAAGSCGGRGRPPEEAEQRVDALCVPAGDGATSRKTTPSAACGAPLSIWRPCARSVDKARGGAGRGHEGAAAGGGRRERKPLCRPDGGASPPGGRGSLSAEDPRPWTAGQLVSVFLFWRLPGRSCPALCSGLSVHGAARFWALLRLCCRCSWSSPPSAAASPGSTAGTLRKAAQAPPCKSALAPRTRTPSTALADTYHRLL